MCASPDIKTKHTQENIIIKNAGLIPLIEKILIYKHIVHLNLLWYLNLKNKKQDKNEKL